MKYLDYDGTGVKPKKILQRRMRYTSCGDQIQEMWDRDRKIARDCFGRKSKSNGFIYLPRSTFCEVEGILLMRSCLQDSVINSAPRIGKYINKLEL